MCGRYTLVAPGEEVARRFGLPAAPHLEPRYNVAPTQQVPIVRAAGASAAAGGEGGEPAQGDARELALVRWGLVPFFAKDPAIGNRMINARAETVASKPAFRAAFQRRRCLAPATGFYEWLKQGKLKQPFLLRLTGGGLFAIASLFERWKPKDAGDEVAPLESMTLLTCAPNALAATVHDRMPLILPEAAWEAWLDPATPRAALAALLVPYPAEAMEAFPVSRLVNSPANDDPQCVEPLP